MNKRSELHCHTKMSELTGIADVWKLIETAKEMGMPAIAITDNETVQAFPNAYEEWDIRGGSTDGFKVLFGVEAWIEDDVDVSVKNVRGQYNDRVIMIATSKKGFRNIYELISISSHDCSKQPPRIARCELAKHRDGLIIGSCAQNGDVSRAAFDNQKDEDIKKIISFYDFIEVEPVENYIYGLTRSFQLDHKSVNEIKEIIKHIVKMGKEVSVPVIASANVYYVEKEDIDAFRILRHAVGFRDTKEWKAKHHLMSTEEMLIAFSFLGEMAKEIVIDNPNSIVGKLDVIQPMDQKKQYPKYPKADELLQEICYRRAHKIYGDSLPREVRSRIELELEGILKNGFASIYMTVYELVRKSKEGGHIAGVRGMGGASFVSFLLGISEMNSLPAHYRCDKCRYVDFNIFNAEGYHIGDVGLDLPNRICPVCGEVLLKDGYDLMAETFLGLNMDWEPVYNFNVSHEYLSGALAGVTDIEGIGEIYRLCTIGTLHKKEAVNYVKKYFKDRHCRKSRKKILKISDKLVGVKRRNGTHPGGIIPIPEGINISSYTPIIPGSSDGIMKTQIEYKDLWSLFQKLIIYQNSDLSLLKYLSDETGIDPVTIPTEDDKIMSLFSGIEPLDIKPDLIAGVNMGTLGVHDFGCNIHYFRKIFEQTRPKRFSDVIRITSIMRGTWHCNPFEFIKDRKILMSEFISSRDDVMLYLIDRGIDRERAFEIMELYCKGGAFRNYFKEEWIDELLEKGVPNWYIELLTTITYLFPKAHSANEALLSWRLLYFKLYYPKEFYKGWLKYMAHEIDEEFAKRGYDFIKGEYELLAKKNPKMISCSQKDKKEELLVVMEMYARGIHLA